MPWPCEPHGSSGVDCQRGRASATTEGADEHIDALSKKYINQDEYPFRQPGEERIKFVIEPEHIRHQKQG